MTGVSRRLTQRTVGKDDAVWTKCRSTKPQSAACDLFVLSGSAIDLKRTSSCAASSPAYIVDFSDIPDIIASGQSLGEAFNNACEALDLHLESLQKLGNGCLNQSTD